MVDLPHGARLICVTPDTMDPYADISTAVWRADWSAGKFGDFVYAGKVPFEDLHSDDRRMYLREASAQIEEIYQLHHG
jgi:hypothetical protein